MTAKRPPYHPNPDGTHCWQCCLKMAIEHFDPSTVFSFPEIAAHTGKLDGMWSWPTRTYLWLPRIGYDFVAIAPFDLEAFAAAPEQFLIDYYGAEGAKECIRFSDIPKEAAEARAFVQSGNAASLLVRPATLDDVRRLLDDGWLVGVWCDQRVLDGKEGFCGHFILAYDYDENGFYVHNPDSTTGCPEEGAANYLSSGTLAKAGWFDRGKGDILAIRQSSAA